MTSYYKDKLNILIGDKDNIFTTKIDNLNNIFTRSSYYSFLIPFLIISSIFIDVLLEYSISLNIGSLFYTINNGSYISYLIINSHFSILVFIIPIIIISIIYHFLTSYFLGNILTKRTLNIYSMLSIINSNSIFFIPIYQDIFILMSYFFFRGPMNLLEVMSCLNYCFNLYHIHYFNVILIIYILLIILLIMII